MWCQRTIQRGRLPACAHDIQETLIARKAADWPAWQLNGLEDLIGENDLLQQRTKMLLGQALHAELNKQRGHHDQHETVASAAYNTRNVKSRTTLKDELGEFFIEVPQDRHGSLVSQIISKHPTAVRTRQEGARD